MATQIIPGGELHIVFGPMFCGKTTELLRLERRHERAKRRCAVIKYIKDTRYSLTKCCTHDLLMCDAISVGLLADLPSMDDYDVVAIDEGQFFLDIVTVVPRLIDAGKIVIIAALDGTSKREPFGDVLALCPLSDTFKKFHAVCACGKDAIFTGRKGEDKSKVLIGGEDLYVALCRGCYDRIYRSSLPVS